MEIAETFGDEGFDIPRRYFAAVAILVGVVIALGGGGERQFTFYVFALACAIAALSFFASVARLYRRRGWMRSTEICAPARRGTRFNATTRTPHRRMPPEWRSSRACAAFPSPASGRTGA
ncbi:hypothetical protein DF041_32225 [Burkholderia cepacia]|nr:hypothetical protein DF041_32225 [Burkholderia cepacia]